MNTRYRCLVAMFLACLLSAPVLLSQGASALFEQGLIKENAEGTLNEAIAIFGRIAGDTTADAAIRAKAQLHVGICYEKLGDAQARGAYERLIADFPQQTSEVTAARARLAALDAGKPAQASGPGFRKITMPGEVSPGAQLSPDGSRLAMVSGGDVWVVKLQGQVAPEIAGVPERLSQGANAAWSGLTWSGNGKWIAFNEATIPTQTISVLPVSGGAIRKVARAAPMWGGDAWWLGLSSDGSRLAYSTRLEDRLVLQVVSVDTGETVMRVANPDALEPRFSPDDTHVAYVRLAKWPADALGDVRVVRLADRSEVPVTETPTLFRSLAWSPDGSQLAFLAHPNKDDRSVEEVWITPALKTGKAAGEPTKIKLPRFAQSLAGWTVDNKIGLLSSSPSRNAIHTVPPSGGKATQVTPNGDTFQPQWSPDGKRIFFRWRQGDIAVVPAAGGTISVVPRSGERVVVTLPNGGNHVSPDGKRMVWAGVRKTIPGVHLWTMPIAGGEPVQLPMKPDLNAFEPRWSPDGQWIAFESERDVPGGRKLDENIFIVSSQGGEPRQLTHHTDCYCELMAWSPGGDSIAYACSDEVIRIIPAGGGEPRIVLKVDGFRSHSGSLAWTLDGSRLMYSAKGRLWTVSAAGGEPTAITTDLDGNIMQFALSPDGGRIAFNAPSGGDLELWFMEGFLPLVKSK